MNLILTLEALKFYKIKHERLVQIAFVFLYLVNIAPYVLPVGDMDFSGFFYAAEQFMQDPSQTLPLLSAGNLISIGLIVLTGLVDLMAALAYAALMAGEHSGYSGKIILVRLIKGLPALVLTLLLLLVPVILSSFLFMIPAMILVTNLYILPVLLLSENRKLSEALQATIQLTKGFKMMILLQMFFLSILLSLPESLVLGFLPQTLLTSILVPQFFVVLQAFAQGRLLGMFYLYLVKKVPVVIPSKPQL
ncbi:MAG: hypothetical protein EOM08_00230 [Clostridia bacterium]|nr:hypothetical protein [Clostridia bacterium]NCC74850.1 hypothetical protein [Clostridia bacterium]